VANHKKTAKPRKPTHHLPKVGTPADDAYRLRRSREDLVDFGLVRPRGGAVAWIIAGAALVLLVLGLVALIALT
jgi:hypothetical protein